MNALLRVAMAGSLRQDNGLPAVALAKAGGGEGSRTSYHALFHKGELHVPPIVPLFMLANST